MGIKNLFSRKKNTEPRKLIESYSPNCNIQAIVEEDDRCVYFYLFGQADFQEKFMNSCWVRNYEEAPEEIDIEAMENGKAPLLPSVYCSHPNGSEKLDKSKLEIIWFEEGDGAALLYKNEILCVIPSWSSPQCPGYSRDCIKDSQFAWPLGSPSDNVLFERVRKAKEFWENWKEDSWEKLSASYIETLESSFGKYTKYYAIDGGYWPPKAMVTFENDKITYVITLGVFIIPQPKVEMYFDKPEYHRRFEFGFAIETELLKRNENGILSYISGQTRLPWSCIQWLGHGHTIPIDQIWPDSKEFPYVLLMNSNEIKDIPKIDFPLYREDPINVLWMVPITQNEQEYAKNNGSAIMLKEHSKNKDNLWVFSGESKFNI